VKKEARSASREERNDPALSRSVLTGRTLKEIGEGRRRRSRGDGIE
jgi:hypothetical protein